ncbi:hypothetical protein BX265_7198 [Streptomyces sp. TLI_235]|nr:hypothetical protein BX265_7198 [Streptomyces sp. TLI_235]
MNPDQLRVLRNLVSRSFAVLAAPDGEGHLDLDDEDKVHLTQDVTNELLVVLAIAATGTMEHHVVDLGNGAATIMDADAANDPQAVQEMRDRATKQLRVRKLTERRKRARERVAGQAATAAVLTPRSSSSRATLCVSSSASTVVMPSASAGGRFTGWSSTKTHASPGRPMRSSTIR